MKRNGRKDFIHWFLIISSVLWTSLGNATTEHVPTDVTDSVVKDNNIGDNQVNVTQNIETENSQNDEPDDTPSTDESTNSQEEEPMAPADDTINEEDTLENGDELVDTPQIVDDSAVSEDSYYQVHSLKLMLYIICPVGALVIIYFVMKTVKGNSRHFFNRYQMVGTRADNIELRPLGYESDEEDIVFDSSTRN